MPESLAHIVSCAGSSGRSAKSARSAAVSAARSTTSCSRSFPKRWRVISRHMANGWTAQHLRIMCPVNVRTEGQQGALGNQVSAIFPMLPAWPMNPVTRLGAVCAEVERIKEEQEAQALTLLQNSVPEPWPVAMVGAQLIGTRFDPTALAARIPFPVQRPRRWLAAAELRSEFCLHERAGRAGAAIFVWPQGARYDRRAGLVGQHRARCHDSELQPGAVFQLHLRAAFVARSAR